MTSTIMSSSTDSLDEIRVLRGAIECDREENGRRWEAIEASVSRIAVEPGRERRSDGAALALVQLLFVLVVGVSAWNGEWARDLVLVVGSVGVVAVWLLQKSG